MKQLFHPESVVVIGVSERPSNLGKEIARNLFEFRYNGVIYFVGREGGVIFGHRIYTSLEDVPDGIDLAIVLTPAQTVPGFVEVCGRKGIKRLVIESGGFGELDDSGKKLGLELRGIADKYGIRFIGPNCIGLMNASNGLATPFTTMQNVFRKGGVGILAQSGGVALSFLNMFNGEQLGYSKFAAVGNKLSIDENDILEYYVEDPSTSVVCMYLESIADGRRFAEIISRSQKPVVVHKANTGGLSSHVAQSHTEALANDDRVVEAALRQAGAARFRDMQSYLDFVKILQLPRMLGRNLAIVSRSGGHAVIAADAAGAYNFLLPPFERTFLDEIRKHLRADVIHLANPLDLGDLFDFDVYVRIVEHTLQQESIHGIVFLHTYFAAIEGASSRRLLQSIAELSRKYDKPVAMCVSTEQNELSVLHKEFDFPIFMSPERAIFALDSSIKYFARREFINQNHEITRPEPAPDQPGISRVLNVCKAEARSPLLHEALGVVRSAGIGVPEYQVMSSGAYSQLIAFAGPYAIKVISEEISHKSDAGGVALNVVDEAEAGRIVNRMKTKFKANKVDGFLVQSMVGKSVGAFELIVGAKRDAQFGPMVLLGHGGIFVEVFGKTSLRMAPLSRPEIDLMINELPGSEIFAGVRGRPAINRNALVDVIHRIAVLMVDNPDISSIDINPLVVDETGAVALDARIFLD
jgi:acetate---CoA ligase (ADP-forming)